MRQKHTGVALISVLVVVALLAVLATATSARVRSETRLAANLLAAAQARSAAEAGVQLGLYRFAEGSAETRWHANGAVHELRLGEALVRVALQDEAGKLDLNLAPQLVLANLLGAELAERIVERRKDVPFESVDQIQAIPGMRAELFRQTRQALTVHSRQPGVVADAATRQVLLAIPGTDAREVDGYIELRARNREAGLEPPPAPSSERRYLVRNGNATIGVHAHARLPGGAAAQVTATIDARRPGGTTPFRIIDWRHDGEELF